MPKDITIRAKTPNKTTLQAIKEAKAGNVKSAKNISELFKK